MAKKPHNPDGGYAEAEHRIKKCRRTGETSLDLGRLGLTRVPPEIGKLTALTTLELRDNRLTSLPPEIGKLTALTTLNLFGNRLTSLPPEIEQLDKLFLLELAHNQLTGLPREIGKLTALRTLGLISNRLTSLPPEIGKLASLTRLDLNNNQLTSLPSELKRLRALEELFLHDNSELGIPAEALGPAAMDVWNHNAKPKPPREILNYYFRTHPEIECDVDSEPPPIAKKPRTKRTSSATGRVLEARVIVIGDGGAGKTSVVRALLHNMPAHMGEETTRDVVVEDWPDLKLSKPGDHKKYAVSVHVWDFGGQEPMHAAHPYFFSNRVLYLIVAPAGDVRIEERIAYWLKMIEAHGKGARAFVAVNKADQHPMDIKCGELIKAFPDSLHADLKHAFFETSCIGKMEGIAELRSAILSELASMDQIWKLMPSAWQEVKTLLELRRARQYDSLTMQQWDELCDQAKVPVPDRSEALELLCHLGTVVSFPKHDELAMFGVLNPSWVTGGIYSLLTSPVLATAGGLLEWRDISKLLNDPNRYPKHKHGWLINLMKKFELIFENEGRLLLLARLPTDAPDWVADSTWQGSDVLHLEFRFTVLPESVISKFIARWHERACHPSSWWRHGIAVKDDRGHCQALVRAHLGDPGRIELKVRGPKVARQGFVAVLRDQIDRLSQKLGGELWLLLDGVYPKKYDDLLILVYNGTILTITDVVDQKVRNFDLTKALDLIEPKEC